jgi:hypothetical protein
MWAVPTTPGGKPWKVIDVSSGGAALIGEFVVPEGTVMDILLSAPFLERTGSKLDVTATIEVVRHIYTESDTPVGMGVAWLHLRARGSDSAFRDFLRGILCLETGYIQTSESADECEYVFARSALPIVADVPPNGCQGDDSSKAPSAFPGAFQCTFPTIFQTDRIKGTGFAIKVMTHAMRIATKGNPPEPYNRIKIGIKIGEDLLELAGTVGNVKKAAAEGQESRFDIQLSLGNNPGDLNAYRRHIEELARRTADRA